MKFSNLLPNRVRYLNPRLECRESLSADELCDRFFSDLPREEVVACLSVLDGEGLPVDRMRPEDDLDELLKPPPTSNPVAWFFRRGAYEDIIGELSYVLSKRVTDRGDAPVKVVTLADYVRAWCADHP